MSPSDIEEQIFRDPFIPIRLTLASGDQVILDNPSRILISSISLHYALADDPSSRIGKQVKIISIPNIVLIEPVSQRPGSRGRRPRR